MCEKTQNDDVRRSSVGFLRPDGAVHLMQGLFEAQTQDPSITQFVSIGGIHVSIIWMIQPYETKPVQGWSKTDSTRSLISQTTEREQENHIPKTPLGRDPYFWGGTLRRRVG